jgi:RNA polymerase sigma factor (sigma-70 family)
MQDRVRSCEAPFSSPAIFSRRSELDTARGEKLAILYATQPRQEDLDKFFRQVRPTIERYVSRRVRNQDHSEEIVSRVFEAVTRTWNSFRGDCPTEAYAIAIAANALKNYYARDIQKSSKQISLDAWTETYTLQHDPSVVGPFDRLESADWVKDLLTEMNRCCTQAESGIIAMFYQGQTFDEISALLGMNAATVRGHFLRGRKKLLVHLFLERPEMLGGEEAFLSTVAQIQSREPSLLTKEESCAIQTRSGPAEDLRGAMLKIVPYLEGLP